MFALALVLAAAPVDVIVLDARQSEGGRKLATKALQGRALIDATELHRYLVSPPGLLDFQDFEAFTTGPTQGWPSTLEEAWKRGVAQCRLVAGPPPWRATLPSARCCGMRLGRHLWGQYLAEKKVDQVYLVSAAGDEPLTVKGVRHGSGDDELVVTRAGTAADEERLVAAVLELLLANTGSRTPRERVPTLFTPVEGDPWAGAQPLSTPVAEVKGCDALPASLTVAGDSVTGSALAARWLEAVKGKAPAMACSLNFTTHRELKSPSMIIDDPIVTTLLTCGATTVSVELVTGPMTKKPLDVVTSRLISALAGRLCK